MQPSGAVDRALGSFGSFLPVMGLTIFLIHSSLENRTSKLSSRDKRKFGEILTTNLKMNRHDYNISTSPL
jgi:uncharacterized membrane protein YbaN (DUF454 family)